MKAERFRGILVSLFWIMRSGDMRLGGVVRYNTRSPLLNGARYSPGTSCWASFSLLYFVKCYRMYGLLSVSLCWII